MSFAPRVAACTRCGHWHGQTMVKRIVRNGHVLYRAAHLAGAEEHRDRTEAVLDQCYAWADEQAEEAGS